jgi:hypothetical protein
MKISELQAQLEAIKQEHGDLEVFLNREYHPHIEEVSAYERSYYNVGGRLCFDPLAVWIY